ncbi:MAG: MFS transporter [Burkholderiaceae bacterium]|nr:MFS transporter [Burkholderiaceae bacterium]
MRAEPGAVTIEPASAGSAGLAAYAAFGLPLAMMALPVYVLVPKFYAEATGLALATIGALLLGTRLLDAFADPLLGVWVDAQRGPRNTRNAYLRPIFVAALPLTAGFVLLFHPPQSSAAVAAVWLGVTLLAAYLGYSLASIAYQAWGAGLAHEDAGRARVTAAREGAGLVGVIVASVVPVAFGVTALVLLFATALAATLALLALRAPRANASAWAPARAHLLRRIAAPLAASRFRWLLAVFVLNGIAAAIPATLVLFFVADRLAPPGYEGLFLALYFVAGAASMLLWARLARRFSLPLVWLLGMLAAVAAFVWAYWLGAGDLLPFAAICLLSGLALGADLALPPALLARVIDDGGDGGRREGAYFGLWNFVNKLNLALAAGVALPLLQWLGYTPGDRGEDALAALSASYALLPSALKLAAATVLLIAWRGRRF